MTEAGLTEAERIIETLGLQPHPEGGWYRQTWVGPEREGRASGTAILFLLRAAERSHWHRVDADEIWIWNAGAALILSIGQDVAQEVRLGPDVLGGRCRRLWCLLAGGRPRGRSGTGRWSAAPSVRGFALRGLNWRSRSLICRDRRPDTGRFQTY